MEIWLIYLIVSLFIIWTIGITLYPKLKVKLSYVTIAILVAAIVIVTPTISLWRIDVANDNAKVAEARFVTDAFNSKYSDNYAIIRATKTDAYLVIRAVLDENGKVDLSAGTRQSLLIGNTWLEIESIMDSGG